MPEFSGSDLNTFGLPNLRGTAGGTPSNAPAPVAGSSSLGVPNAAFPAPGLSSIQAGAGGSPLGIHEQSHAQQIAGNQPDTRTTAQKVSQALLAFSAGARGDFAAVERINNPEVRGFEAAAQRLELMQTTADIISKVPQFRDQALGELQSIGIDTSQINFAADSGVKLPTSFKDLAEGGYEPAQIVAEMAVNGLIAPKDVPAAVMKVIGQPDAREFMLNKRIEDVTPRLEKILGEFKTNLGDTPPYREATKDGNINPTELRGLMKQFGESLGYDPNDQQTIDDVNLVSNFPERFPVLGVDTSKVRAETRAREEVKAEFADKGGKLGTTKQAIFADGTSVPAFQRQVGDRKVFVNANTGEVITQPVDQFVAFSAAGTPDQFGLGGDKTFVRKVEQDLDEEIIKLKDTMGLINEAAKLVVESRGGVTTAVGKLASFGNDLAANVRVLTQTFPEGVEINGKPVDPFVFYDAVLNDEAVRSSMEKLGIERAEFRSVLIPLIFSLAMTQARQEGRALSDKDVKLQFDALGVGNPIGNDPVAFLAVLKRTSGRLEERWGNFYDAKTTNTKGERFPPFADTVPSIRENRDFIGSVSPEALNPAIDFNTATPAEIRALSPEFILNEIEIQGGADALPEGPILDVILERIQ